MAKTNITLDKDNDLFDLLTSSECGEIYGKHKLTIETMVKKFGRENVDYRYMMTRKEYIIRRSFIEQLFLAEHTVKLESTVKIRPKDRKPIEDRLFEI